MSEKIIHNWIGLAEYDMETAKAMFDSGRYLYVAFMCQQAIEKLLKACYVKQAQQTPPHTHNVLRLAKSLSLASEMDNEKLKHLEALNSYYIESRYTEEISELSMLLTKAKAGELLQISSELFKWIRTRI